MQCRGECLRQLSNCVVALLRDRPRSPLDNLLDVSRQRMRHMYNKRSVAPLTLGKCAGQHLVQDNAERIHIRETSGVSSEQLLWWHVGLRADTGIRFDVRGILEQLRQAK